MPLAIAVSRPNPSLAPQTKLPAPLAPQAQNPRTATGTFFNLIISKLFLYYYMLFPEQSECLYHSQIFTDRSARMHERTNLKFGLSLG